MSSTPLSAKDKHASIVIVNQHGDNRGDEAAMRAMVAGLTERFGDPKITIVHQFSDPESKIDLGPNVSYQTLILPLVDAARIALLSPLIAARVPVERLAGPKMRPVLEAIKSADLVVSAPGGPYFGDLYASHEVVHWYFAWLARRYRRPLFMYAPSCGPFNNRLLKPLRTRGYRWFDAITLREQRSADMLREFTGIEAIVTTDSALQDVVSPADRSEFAGDDERLVVVAVRKPTTTAAEAHDEAIVAGLNHLAANEPTAFVFLPQIHGPRHQDEPYLTGLAEQVQGAAKVTVVPDTTDSERQRAITAAGDLVIAGRYHPAVFSISSGVPAAIIPYEHKAQGVADAAGVGEFTVWVDDLTPENAVALIDQVVSRSDEIRATLARTGPELRALSATTSDLAFETASPK